MVGRTRVKLRAIERMPCEMSDAPGLTRTGGSIHRMPIIVGNRETGQQYVMVEVDGRPPASLVARPLYR